MNEQVTLQESEPDAPIPSIWRWRIFCERATQNVSVGIGIEWRPWVRSVHLALAFWVVGIEYAEGDER